MKRAIAYLRVSTSKQVNKEVDPEGLSLPVQKQYATDKAAQLDAVIEEFYIERGQSARTMRRDELQRMVKRLADGDAVDYVIVLSVNRLARDVGDFDRIWDDVITRYGATLVSVLETFDNSPSGRFMAHVLAAKAEYDSAQTGERVRMGMARKAQVGGTVGRAPIGYVNAVRMVEGRPVKLVEIDETRSPYIIEAFQRYGTGDWSLIKLLDLLTEKGLRTRASTKRSELPMALSQFHRLLGNPYYVGDVTVKGVTYPGRHDALIDRALFQRVQDVLDAHNTAGERDRNHKHWAKGLVYCGQCQARMTLNLAKGTYFYWFCLGRAHRKGCTQPYVAVEQVEALIEEALSGYRLEPEELAAARADLLVHLEQERTSSAREIERQGRRIAGLKAEQTKLLRLHLQPGGESVVPLDLLQREQTRLGTELAAAEGTRQAAQAAQGDEERHFDAATAFLLDPVARFRALPDDEAKRELAFAIFERVWVNPGQALRTELRPELGVLLQAVQEGRGMPRYHRSAVRSSGADLEPARALDAPNPTEHEAGRVLVGAGAPAMRVRVSNRWSG